MSISNAIMEYVAALPPSQLTVANPHVVARAINAAPDKVSKLMWSLEHTGRIKLIREGRSIVGVEEVLRAIGQQGRRSESPRAAKREGATEPHVRSTRTPLLDRYEQAKRRAEAFSADDSEFFEVTFRENPVAEEGLKLRDALASIEAKYRELSSQYKLMVYEYEGVKQRMRDRATRNVVEAKAEQEKEN